MNVLETIRLLIVDDEADFRAPLKKRLAKRGVQPLEAGGWEECQSMLKSNPFDVVILDVKMPGMNGLDILVWIRKNYPQTEVILLTGHASATDGVEGIKKGAFDYLTKPVEFEHLVRKITQAFEKRIREEEKKKEAEFKAQMEQQMISTERLASLGTLSTGIAHEIDNPLAIIKESVEYMRLLLNKIDESNFSRKADFENAVNKIDTAIERAKRITHQLLGFVRQSENLFTQTDLNLLIAETIEFVSKEAENRDIEIILNLKTSKGVIWSDPFQIRQVLFNLITNAIAAVRSGGTITVSLNDNDSHVVISISDNGEGIPKENQIKIFEPFFTTKPPGKGTGLGLYVSRGIVDQLGGKIEVSSQVGKGSCFLVTLPRCAKNCSTIKDNKDICAEILNRIKGDPAV